MQRTHSPAAAKHLPSYSSYEDQLKIESAASAAATGAV